jgi:WD40 repeat protein
VLRVDDGDAVSVRRLSDGAPLWSEPLKDIRSLAVSTDRQRILAAAEADNGSIIRVWDAMSGKRLLDERQESMGGEAVFDRSGRYAAVLFGEVFGIPEGLPQGGGLKIWDLSSGREALSVPESQRVVGLAFTHDSNRVAIVLQQGGLIVQDLQSGQMKRTVGASVGPVAFSSSGNLLAFGGRSIRVLETESLRVVAQVDVMRQARRVEFRSDDAVLAVDSFPDGDPRGLTQLLRWRPEDVLGDACRVMPIDAAIKQWQQLFPDSAVPSPCAGVGSPESAR